MLSEVDTLRDVRADTSCDIYLNVLKKLPHRALWILRFHTGAAYDMRGLVKVGVDRIH